VPKGRLAKGEMPGGRGMGEEGEALGEENGEEEMES
jgi:hypothetical protein